MRAWSGAGVRVWLLRRDGMQAHANTVERVLPASSRLRTSRATGDKLVLPRRGRGVKARGASLLPIQSYAHWLRTFGVD